MKRSSILFLQLSERKLRMRNYSYYFHAVRYLHIYTLKRKSIRESTNVGNNMILGQLRVDCTTGICCDVVGNSESVALDFLLQALPTRFFVLSGRKESMLFGLDFSAFRVSYTEEVSIQYANNTEMLHFLIDGNALLI